MEEVFGRIGGRFKISITDSTMMWMLHCAMDKAHERVQTKDGVIQRLNEISKFYELAVMQLEGCLKFVQEETDSSPENSDEELLVELMEIKDHLQRRLKESERAIFEKDRELNQRIDTELRLQQALEFKDRELDSLRAKLEFERSKSKSIEDSNLENPSSVVADRDDEFSELKNSVDQQVWDIKQKLDLEYEHMNNYRSQGFDNLLKIEDMSADIDVLKETLDIAIGKMECAMSLFGLEPIEHQWMWTIEMDTHALLLRGFLQDVQERLQTEVKRRETQVASEFRAHLSDLAKDVTHLHDELEYLNQASLDSKASLKVKGRSAEESNRRPDDLMRKPDETNQLAEEESIDDEGHYVAKMIKNHESIIRKKSEELNWLKREMFGDKGSSFHRKDKEPVSLIRRVQEFITRLEDLAHWDSEHDGTIHDYSSDESKQTLTTKLHPGMSFQAEYHVDAPEDINGKENTRLVSYGENTQIHRKVRMLRNKNDDETYLESILMKEIHVILLEGILCEFCLEHCRYDLEILIREATYKDALHIMAHERNEQMESYKLQVQIQQQLHFIIFNEAMNQIFLDLQTALGELQKVNTENNCLYDHKIKAFSSEGITWVVLREMFRNWKKRLESYQGESLVSNAVEGIAYKAKIRETIKEADKFNVVENLMDKSSLSVEFSVREDIWMIFMREMSKEWVRQIESYTFQSRARKEVNQLIFADAIKEARVTFQETKVPDHLKAIDDSISHDWLHKSPEANGEEILIRKRNSLLKCIEFEEDLIHRASAEVKDFNANVDLVELNCKELEQLQVSQEWLAEMENTLTSVSNKVEKALEQLAVSKAILNELRSTLGISNNKAKGYLDYQAIPATIVAPWFQRHVNKEKEIAVVDSALLPIMRFSQVFVDFQCRAEERLDLNSIRLEEAITRLNSAAEIVGSLRRNESVYKKAFTRRCENLRKAELEVDMLGDQVDLLLGVLEKTYYVLQHYLPVFEHHFEVSEIMNMIKRELSRRIVGFGK